MVHDKVTLIATDVVDKRDDRVTRIVPLPYKHRTRAVGFITLQPIVTTPPPSLKGGTEHF